MRAIETGHQASADVQAAALRATESNVASVTSPEILTTVGASSHGYEGMLKDLIKQLPDKPPTDMKAGSDLAKLFEAKANPESIGQRYIKSR